MRTIAAIAKLTIREAIRSRLVLVVSLLLALMVVAMPFLLHGDGTHLGVVRMILAYPMAAAVGILVVANLWIGCALISGDAAARTLALTMVKPVAPWQLWLGKWLGLMLLNLLLLSACHTVTSWQATHRIARNAETVRTMRRARQAVKPVLPTMKTQFEEVLAVNRHLATTPQELQELKRQIMRELPYHVATLQRGASWQWHFKLDAPPRAAYPVWLRLRFDTDAFTRAIVRADCQLRGDTSGTTIPFALDDFSSRQFEVALNSSGFTNDTSFTLTMHHTGDETTGPLLIQPRQDLELLIPRASLLHNTLRALLVHLALLALLAAIGITLGTLFSLPVAAFSATGLLLAVLISLFVVSDPDALDEPHLPPEANLVQRLQTGITTCTPKLLTTLAKPALTPAPLQQLSGGILVPRRDLTRALTINLLLLPLLCCLLSAAILARRELP